MQCSLISTFIIGSAVYAPPECLYWAVTVTSAAFPASDLSDIALVIASAACTFRAAMLMSIALHEAAHLLTAVILCKAAVAGKTCSPEMFSNVAGNTAMKIWLACLHPLQTWPCSFCPNVVLPGNSSCSFPDDPGCAHKLPPLHAWQAQHLQQEQSCLKHRLLWSWKCLPCDSNSCIRAAGWTFSCVLALWMAYLRSQVLSAAATASVLQQELGVMQSSDVRRLLLTQVANGFWATAAAAIASDMLGWQAPTTCPRGVNTFFCGNFGLLMADACNHSVDAVKVLYDMASVCMARGAQSGGMVVHSGTADSKLPPARKAVRLRVTSSRRANLASSLKAALERKLWWEKLSKFRPLWRSQEASQHVPVVYAGHCRFATSSAATRSESHPHQWTPSATATVWRPVQTTAVAKSKALPAQAGSYTDDSAYNASSSSARLRWRLLPMSTSHGIYVTHNGDFEFLSLFGERKTCAEVKLWLASVLGAKAPAECDSVGIAGMVELLRTQGLWLQSLRLAYQQCKGRVAEEGADKVPLAKDQDLEAGFPPCQPPSMLQLQALSAITEQTLTSFRPWCKQQQDSDLGNGSRCRQMQMKAALGGAKGMAAAAKLLQAAFTSHAHAEGGRQPWLAWLAATASWEAFCRQAMHNFVHNDLFWAVRHFMNRAQGSFGLAVLSELDGGSLVLAALQQPMTLTFAPNQGLLLYSSETQATLQPLHTHVHPSTQSPSPSTSVPVLSQLSSPSACQHASDSDYLSAPSAAGSDSRQATEQATYRIDMDESAGEVFLLKFQSPTTPSPVRSKHSAGTPCACHDSDLQGTSHAAWPLFGSTGSSQHETLVGDASSATSQHKPASVAALAGDSAAKHRQLHLAVYSLAQHSMVSRQEFLGQHRLTCLQGNPYMAQPCALPATTKPWKHQAERDLAEIPAVLHVLRNDWQDPNSFNCQTACDFSNLVQSALTQRTKTLPWITNQVRVDEHIVHLLLVATEASLWTAERFAEDLKATVPALHVLVMSSNKLIAMLENAAGTSIPAKFASIRLGTSLDKQHTAVLCISHSGQTFPTIHAARMLSIHLPGRIFVMSGSVDTKMSLAMGQQIWKGAAFSRRIFVTHAGWRQAEPASMTAVATHHCLTELLIHLTAKLLNPSLPGSSNPDLAQHCRVNTGVMLSTDDIVNLRYAQNVCIDTALPRLVGWSHNMKPLQTAVHTALVKQGRWWGAHVLEAPWAWLLAALYIAATVISGHPPLTAIFAATRVYGLEWLGRVLDSLMYMFSPVIACFLLRVIQGRPLLARLGRRTVVIVDVPYVHQLLEAYVSKLFALSYGAASVDVHGADPTDHFVHCFTHRIVRGLLLVVGRPDGRLGSQVKNESWVLLGLLQAKVIRHLGSTAEAMSVGHNPYSNATIIDHSIVLPTSHKNMRCEAAVKSRNDAKNHTSALESLIESRFASLERLIAMQTMFYHMAAHVASFWLMRFCVDRSQSGLRIATTASPVSAADLRSQS